MLMAWGSSNRWHTASQQQPENLSSTGVGPGVFQSYPPIPPCVFIKSESGSLLRNAGA